MPSHDDVAGALVVASVPMTHGLAPPTPALSAQRSRFALEWVSTTFGCLGLVDVCGGERVLGEDLSDERGPGTDHLVKLPFT